MQRDALYRKFDGPLPPRDAVKLRYGSIGALERAKATALIDHFTAECHRVIREMRRCKKHLATADVQLRRQELASDLEFYRAQRNKWRPYLRSLETPRRSTAGAFDSRRYPTGVLIVLSQTRRFSLRSATA